MQCGAHHAPKAGHRLNAYPEDIAKSYCNRIGNLTLLLPADNSVVGNDGFRAKVSAAYASSNFELTRVLPAAWQLDDDRHRGTAKEAGRHGGQGLAAQTGKVNLTYAAEEQRKAGEFEPIQRSQPLRSRIRRVRHRDAGRSPGPKRPGFVPGAEDRSDRRGGAEWVHKRKTARLAQAGRFLYEATTEKGSFPDGHDHRCQ